MQPETDPPSCPPDLYKHEGVMYKLHSAPLDSGCTTFAASSLEGFVDSVPTKRRMGIASEDVVQMDMEGTFLYGAFDEQRNFVPFRIRNAVQKTGFATLFGACLFWKNGHEVVLAGENPRINLRADGLDGRKVIAQVVPLRLMGNLTFFDYYVPTDVSTQPTTEWALSGRLLEPMDLEPQAEATVIAASDVQSVNLPSVRDSQYFLHRRMAHIGDDMYDATVKCVVNLPKRVAGRGLTAHAAH